MFTDTTLTDATLVEIRASLLRWSENPAHSNTFRTICSDAASKITQHLSGGVGNRDALAEVLEMIYGPLARAEIARMDLCAALALQMQAALERGDGQAWARGLRALLPITSEPHAAILMEQLAGFDQSGAAPEMGMDAAFIHSAPVLVQ